MSDQGQILSKATMPDVMDWLEEELKAKGIDDEKLYTAELLVEENFLQMKRNAREPKDEFTADITIEEWFGDITVRLAFRCEIYRPPANYVEATLDNEEYASQVILNAHKKQFRTYRKKGRTIVDIKVHESENKQVRYTLCSIAAGILLGILLKEAVADPMTLSWIEDNILNSVQTMFLHVLLAFAAPMVFFSILSGIISLSDTTTLSRMGKKISLYSIPKLAFYTALGLFVGHSLGGIPEITETIVSDAVVPDMGTPLRDLIVGIVPGDIITPFHTNNVLQMLFLACISGVLLAQAGSWAGWAKNGISFFPRFFMEITDLLLPFIPLVVLVSMIKITIHTGIDALMHFGKLVFWAAMGLPMSLLISRLLIFLLGRLSPMPFLKKTAAYIPLPFSLCSSTACLPATLTFCREKLGMNEKFTKFSIPVGMQLNMDGTAYYVAIVSMMLANTFGLTIDPEFYLCFFLIHLLVSLTGIGLLAMTSIYVVFGIPEAAIAMIIGLEPVMDMFGTAQSVVGNITSSFLVCRGEKSVDQEIYHRSGK